MSAPAPAVTRLPRELVLASAGTGKTFRIASRIIGLLAAGVRPEDVFASTFTRKAAGEILDRVLARLARAALDAAAAERLAADARLDPAAPGPPPEPGFWLGLLQRLVRDLHRLNIGTLDAFVVRTASSFAEEAGLPPGWSIGDEPTMARLRAEALQDVLAGADRGIVVELLRAAAGGAAQRSVHDRVLTELDQLLELHYALDPDALDPWAGLATAVEPPAADLEERRDALARRLRAVQPPVTRGGAPRAHWARGLADAADAVEAGEWEKLLALTLCQRAREPGARFDRVAVPDEVCALFADACGLARTVLGARLALRGRMQGRLVGRYAEALERRQLAAGAFEFGDLTRLLGGPQPLCARHDLHYRLDARVQHILLDEFQDTSLAQWEVMRPLLEELLDGYEGERAAVIVADPKQSIYAWRGGEPLLVRHVGERYDLAPDRLTASWRSSQVVLDLVNRVFAELGGNPVFERDPDSAAAAGEWAAAFTAHAAVHALPGHVRLTVGPPDEGPGEDRPRLCCRAAELVAELREAAPGRTIGVLTRKNGTVARVMLELRRLGVPASEEGGNPLTDAAPVAAVLALLRLADHPGDLVSRYHVATSPLGAVVRLRDHRDDTAARRAAYRVRRRLLDDGYGHTLAGLADRVEPACDARERRRLRQLVELGFRHDARPTLRTTDFVRLVETQRVESPSDADVRVMTVHQSKGLEFDIVVLPELDAGLTRGSSRPLPYRPAPVARITRVFPYVGKAVRPLFADVEELQSAARQAHAAELRDGLSGLYVALTRARQALHILIRPDGASGIGSGCTGANLVRHALGLADQPAIDGTVLYETGDPAWTAPPEPRHAAVEPARSPRESGAGAEVVRVALRPSAGRRLLRRMSPSGLAGGSSVDLRSVLGRDTKAAEQGTLAHAWMERIGWIEDGEPSDDELRAIARHVLPGRADAWLAELIAGFRGWIAAPSVRQLLGRSRYPAGATLEREVPFVHREDGALVEGVIDRLVVVHAEGTVVAAEIVDFKTGGPLDGRSGADDERARFYGPQLEAYRRAMAAALAIPAGSVAASLVLLEAGAVLEM